MDRLEMKSPAAITGRGSKRGVMGETTAGVAAGGGCEWSR
jgi:hypothetical protein